MTWRTDRTTTDPSHIAGSPCQLVGVARTISERDTTPRGTLMSTPAMPRTAVRALQAAGTLTGHTLFHPVWQRETEHEIAALDAFAATDVRAALALWNPAATTDRDALVWMLDGRAYSASGLLVRICETAGVDCQGLRDGSFDSSRYWHTVDGVSLHDQAAALRTA